MIWTEDKLEQLRQLWDEGKTANQIALEMGTGRGDITGKARRLNLPNRPNIMASPEEKFVRLVDLISAYPDSHVTIREAAKRVSLAFADADRMWLQFIHAFAWHPEVGAEIYP